MPPAKRVGVGAITLLGGALCLLAIGAGFCGATLHVPRSISPPPSGATTVEITAKDNVRLSAWFWHAPEPNGNCAIVLHGIADSRLGSAGLAPMFLKRGYSVLAPDSRAHGASGGSLVTYGLIEKYDAIGWAQWMRAAGCRKIYALGESLGASILIQAAAVEPVFSAIAAECPYADLQEIAEYRMRQMLRMREFVATPLAKLIVISGMLYADVAYGLDFRQVSPRQSISRTSTPVLLIHGTKDIRTPPSHSIQLAAANRGAVLWLVPDAGHTGASTADPLEFRRRVLDWFETH